MSVNAAAGHSGRAAMLSSASTFVSAKPDHKRTHSVAPEAKQSAFMTSAAGKAAERNAAGSTLDVKL
jgi:hypothetical protein